MGNIRLWPQTEAIHPMTRHSQTRKRLPAPRLGIVVCPSAVAAPRYVPAPADRWCSPHGYRYTHPPKAVLGRRGLPARLLSRRCVPRAACVALRGPLLPRPPRRLPSSCAAGSLLVAVLGAPRLRRAALRPGPCWASGPRAGPTLAPPRPPLRPGLVGAARLRFALGAREGVGPQPLPLGLPLPAAVLCSAVQLSRLVRPPLTCPNVKCPRGIWYLSGIEIQ